jgi:O-antigen ligase
VTAAAAGAGRADAGSGPAPREAAAGRVWSPVSFELAFVLFLFAGRFKQDPRFAWVPVDLTMLFFAASLAAAFVALFRRNFRVTPGGQAQVALGLTFFAWMFATLAWSPGGEYAVQKALTGAIFGAWALAGAALVVAPEPLRVRRLFFWVCAFAAWVAVETVMLLVRQGAVQFVRTFESDYLSLGGVLAIAAAVLLAIGIAERLGALKSLAVAALFVGFTLLLFPLGGRGPLVGVAVAGLVGLGLVLARGIEGGASRGRSLAVLLVILAVSAAGGAWLIQGDEYALAADRFVLLLEGGLGESAATRVEYYQATLRMIGERPLLGLGIGGWPVHMGFGPVRDYPHNLFLETQVELGLPGTVLLLALAGWSLRLWAAGRPDPLGLAAFLVFVTLLLGSMFSSDLSDNRILFWSMGLLGAAGASLREAHGGRSPAGRGAAV